MFDEDVRIAFVRSFGAHLVFALTCAQFSIRIDVVERNTIT